MAKDDRERDETDLRPANDNSAVEELVASDPKLVRAKLVPLVKLLARQAAREWLKAAANGNQEHKAEQSLPDENR